MTVGKLFSDEQGGFSDGHYFPTITRNFRTITIFRRSGEIFRRSQFSDDQVKFSDDHYFPTVIIFRRSLFSEEGTRQGGILQEGTFQKGTLQEGALLAGTLLRKQ